MSRLELLLNEKIELLTKMKEAHEINDDKAYEDAWTRFKIVSLLIRNEDTDGLIRDARKEL